MAGFAARCGTQVPDWMWRACDTCTNREEEVLLSTAICAEQCGDLLSNGVSHLHLYTLNRPALPFAVCSALGIAALPMRLSASCG